jgi:N4-gp56 family major capsid protein
MGAMATTTNPADFANNLQIFMDSNWFSELDFNLRFGKYAGKRTVPGGAGHTSVRFYRSRKANTSGMNRMGTDYNEGAVPTNKTEVSRGYVDAYLGQNIQLATISDLAQAVDPIDTIKLYTRMLGKDAALDYDEVCANAMFANPAVAANKVNANQTTLYGTNTKYERFCGVVNTGSSTNDFASLAALLPSQARLTRIAHIGAITQLRANDVPMINGRYVAITDPRIISDMRANDSVWIAAAVYNPEKLKLFAGGEFELDGAIFAETTRAWREAATYGTRDNTGSIFGVAYMGDEALGVPTLSNGKAGGPGNAPITFLTTKADHSNPAAQFASLSAKSYYGAVLIKTNESTDVPHVCLVRCQSTIDVG